MVDRIFYHWFDVSIIYRIAEAMSIIQWKGILFITEPNTNGEDIEL